MPRIRCCPIWRKAPPWRLKMQRSLRTASPSHRTMPRPPGAAIARCDGRERERFSGSPHATARATIAARLLRRCATWRCEALAARGCCSTTIGSMIGVRRLAARALRPLNLNLLNSAIAGARPMMFPTTIAGSLPKPAWLAEPNKLWPRWRLAGEELAAAKDDATLLAIKLQEDAGIDVVCDGEQSRQHFVHGFLEAVAGIDFDRRVELGIRNDRYKALCPTVTGELRLRSRVHAREARLARAHTTRRLKFTLPGPMTIVDTIADRHYGDRVKMAFAFAELLNEEAKALQADGVDVIQFDEPAFNVYMTEVNDWGIKALERAAEGLFCTTAVHICYGYGIKANTDWKQTLGGEWRQYEETFPVIDASTIQQVAVECRNSKVPLELLGLL